MDGRTLISHELAGSWFGTGLSAHARDRLVDVARIVSFPAGATLMREGDDSPFLGIVTEGRVALRMTVPERGAMTILTVEPGDVVGWSAIVRPHRSTSTAVTTEATTLLVLDAEGLRRLLEGDLALAATLYPRILEALGRRLSATRQQLLDLYAQEREPVPW
jgi:CRP-like cAMP-binding protein